MKWFNVLLAVMLVTTASLKCAADEEKYPYAIPVKDKPGFVTSPYAPDSGYIDVRGFPKGTEVKDPYTQKIFLVPAIPEASAAPNKTR